MLQESLHFETKLEPEDGLEAEICEKVKNLCATLQEAIFCIAKDDAKDNDSRYSNLNLNRNYKPSDFSPVQSVSKSNNNKYCATFKSSDSTVSDNREDKIKLQTWNKLSDSCLTILSLNDKTEGVKKDWKKNDSSNSKNNSTLSLHISAYESSTEATVFNDSFNENDKKVLIKGKSVFDSTIVNQNLFEFPRQQNDKVSEPEMSQFIASQRLLNPNKASGDQHIIYKVQLKCKKKLAKPFLSQSLSTKSSLV